MILRLIKKREKLCFKPTSQEEKKNPKKNKRWIQLNKKLILKIYKYKVSLLSENKIIFPFASTFWNYVMS